MSTRTFEGSPPLAAARGEGVGGGEWGGRELECVREGYIERV